MRSLTYSGLLEDLYEVLIDKIKSNDDVCLDISATVRCYFPAINIESFVYVLISDTSAYSIIIIS